LTAFFAIFNEKGKWYMNKRPPDHRKKPALNLAELTRAIDGYVMDSRVRMQSPRTTEQKREHLGKLLWFLQNKGFSAITESSVQQFIAYIPAAHNDPEGRWGIADPTTGMPGISAKRPVGRNTVRSYFKTLKTFFGWCIKRTLIEKCPMELMQMPTKEDVDVVPMSISQIDQLIEAARLSKNPERNIAMITLLFDRGLRAAELVSLKVKDVDPFTNQITVTGKGNKQRTVYMGRTCGQVMWDYHNSMGERSPEDALFESRDGGHLKPNGLGQVVRENGRRARVTGVRCSPHTIRHSYAVETLEAGASEIYLMRSMGHKTLDSSKGYANFVKASMQRQAAMFSPGDKLSQQPKKKRGRPRNER
jgi:integrase/recombinase XerC